MSLTTLCQKSKQYKTHKAQNIQYKKGLLSSDRYKRKKKQGKIQAGKAHCASLPLIRNGWKDIWFCIQPCLSSGILPNTTFCNSLLSSFLTVLAKREGLNYVQNYRNFVIKGGATDLNLQMREREEWSTAQKGSLG